MVLLKEYFELVYLKAIRILIKHKQYYECRRYIAMYNIYKTSLNAKEKRLEGIGPLEGMMFIGLNPSVSSKLDNLWDDPYGKYFSEMLREAGINPEEIYITNLYKHSTPDNRALNDVEIQIGLKELREEIIMVDPVIIVALGTQVTDSIFPITATKRYTIVPIYHPSYIKRFPDERSKYIESLRRIKKYYESHRVH